MAPFKELLFRIKEEQAENRRLYGKSYCTEYLDYIYLDPVGKLIRPDYVTQHFSLTLEKSGFRKIRFHDLRHPYVKPTTKLYTYIIYLNKATIS